jgi:hypothetical protein
MAEFLRGRRKSIRVFRDIDFGPSAPSIVVRLRNDDYPYVNRFIRSFRNLEESWLRQK